MEFLKREHAPITDGAWAEIDRTAAKILKGQLAGRRFVDVDGPHGWHFSSVGLGRLALSDAQPVDGVEYGLRRSLPLVETRTRFDLEIFELDNVARGADDLELGPLENAVRQAARFEDHAILHGFEDAGIAGLMEASEGDPIAVEPTPESFLDGLADALGVMQTKSVEGPFALVLDQSLFQFVASAVDGYPLIRHVSSLIEGPVVESDVATGGLLASLRGGDYELTLGQDFSIGYESHDRKTVQLFVTESFTFRILDPTALVRLESQE